jgi:hypothetical protein
MDPLTERVFEDWFWLVILMALIGFLWLRHRGKGRSSQWNEAVGKTQQNNEVAQAPKKVL